MSAASPLPCVPRYSSMILRVPEPTSRNTKGSVPRACRVIVSFSGQAAGATRMSSSSNTARYVSRSGSIIENLSFPGRQDFAGYTVKEKRVQCVLQVLHMLADRGLAETQLRRCIGKTPVSIDRCENIELIEFRERWLTSDPSGAPTPAVRGETIKTLLGSANYSPKAGPMATLKIAGCAGIPTERTGRFQRAVRWAVCWSSVRLNWMAEKGTRTPDPKKRARALNPGL